MPEISRGVRRAEILEHGSVLYVVLLVWLYFKLIPEDLTLSSDAAIFKALEIQLGFWMSQIHRDQTA
jgi:hypothetical protein